MKSIIRSCLSAGLIGMAASSQASAICIASTIVFGTVTPTSPTQWIYNFSVVNGCSPGSQQFMTDFFLPYFGDAGIDNIVLPPADNVSTTSSITWSDAIEASNDLFNLPNAGVIHYHVTATPEIDVGGGKTTPGVGYYFATGFSYTAAFGGIDGPFAVQQTPYAGGSYTGTDFVFGDPPIPGSPLAIAALGSTVTPEPGTLTLLTIGLFSTAVVLRRRTVGR